MKPLLLLIKKIKNWRSKRLRLRLSSKVAREEKAHRLEAIEAKLPLVQKLKDDIHQAEDAERKARAKAKLPLYVTLQSSEED